MCKEKIGFFSRNKNKKADIIKAGFKHSSIETMSDTDLICQNCLDHFGDRPQKKKKGKSRILLSKTFELTKSSVTSKVEINVFYSIGRVHATGVSGGLHDFDDSNRFGHYYFSIIQKKPIDPEILTIFEDSLPLEGWKKVKAEQKSENKYILSGPWATDEESSLFFRRINIFFENKLQKNGFTIGNKSENS